MEFEEHRTWLEPARARVVLVGLLALLVYGVTWSPVVTPAPRGDRGADVALNMTTISRIRAGESYYVAVGDELRRRDYPTKPVFNWRTPLHYRAVAALGVDRAGQVLFALAFIAIVAAGWALSPRSIVHAGVAVVALLGAMLTALAVRAGPVVMPEVCAGVLIALSLAAYHRRQFAIGAIGGVAAVFVRELAAPYALVCGLLALSARRRRESTIWVCGGVGYIVYYLIHAQQALSATLATDLIRQHSWVQWQGYPFVLMTLHNYGWLLLLPQWLTPVAAVLGLAGAVSPDAPRQLSLSLLVYVVFFSVVGQRFDYYWGFMLVGLWGYAFVHSVDGLRWIVRGSRPALFRPAAEYTTGTTWRSGQ